MTNEDNSTRGGRRPWDERKNRRRSTDYAMMVGWRSLSGAGFCLFQLS